MTISFANLPRSAAASAGDASAAGSAEGRSGIHFDCRILARFESETTRDANPRSIAARGMLSTTHVSGLCAMVKPPAA